jgi:hypothetical protein
MTAWSIRLQSGDGKIPYIDARDIAAVAAVTLTQPGHQRKKYVITGSEAISYRDATEIIGKTIGRRLRFVDESPDQSRARRVREGYPPAIVESALAISAYQRAGGKTLTITTVVADLTGRPTRTFTEFTPCGRVPRLPSHSQRLRFCRKLTLNRVKTWGAAQVRARLTTNRAFGHDNLINSAVSAT